MKRFLALALFMLLMTGASGCIHMHMDTTLNGDGSGTMVIVYGMSEDVAAAIQELQEMEGMPGMDDQKAPTLDTFDKAEIEKACKESGATLKKFDRSTKDGREQVEMVIDFKDINTLNNVMGEAMGEGKEGGGFRVFKRDDGNYMLVSVEGEGGMTDDDAEEEEAPSPESMQDMNPEAMGKAMEVMGKLMASASELDIAISFTLPSDVIEHNGMKLDGRTVSWEINANNMMTAGQDMGEPEIVFSGKGVKIKGSKPEAKAAKKKAEDSGGW